MLSLHDLASHHHSNHTARRLMHERDYLEAYHHFERMHRRSRARRLWALLTRAPWALRRLADLGPLARSGIRRLPEVQRVPLARIIGTDNRANDFDCAFAPIHPHMRERWLGVAVARAQGRHLPPVELVLVGDGYYVVDGHHRVSVALAYGEDAIDACVLAYADAYIAAAGCPTLVPA